MAGRLKRRGGKGRQVMAGRREGPPRRGVRDRRCVPGKLRFGETGSIRVRKIRDATENVWFIITEDVYYVSGAVLSNWHAGLRTFPRSLCTGCADVTGAEVPARRVGAALVLLTALVLSTSGLASFSC